jgi:hypothetical protein
MAGQIIERGERTWLVRIFKGRDPRTGKRVHAGPNDTSVDTLLDGLLLDYQVKGKRDDWVNDVVRVHLRPSFGIMKAAKLGTDQIRA